MLAESVTSFKYLFLKSLLLMLAQSFMFSSSNLCFMCFITLFYCFFNLICILFSLPVSV